MLPEAANFSSASPSHAGTPQANKEASLNGRKIVYLPAEAKYRPDFENLGVVWLELVDKSALLAKAALPEGWEAIDTPHPYHHFFTLYDQNRLPKVDVFVKSDLHDPKTRVTFLTPEESVRKSKQESEEKQRQETEAAKLARMVQEVRSKRFEAWSQECPFGVFFVLDLKDHGMSASITAHRRSCQGFFSTEEIANKAKEILKKQAGFFDSIFVQKVDSLNVHLVKQGKFEMVDGLTDPNWWHSKGGIVFEPTKKISKLGE